MFCFLDHSWSYFYLVCASILWGSTNPLIRKASRQQQSTATPSSQTRTTLMSFLVVKINDGLELVENWQVSTRSDVRSSFLEVDYYPYFLQLSIPLAVNQLGSVFFLTGLADSKLSFAVPFVNSLTFLITSLTGVLIGEYFTRRHFLGIISIIIGIILCTRDTL